MNHAFIVHGYQPGANCLLCGQSPPGRPPPDAVGLARVNLCKSKGYADDARARRRRWHMTCSVEATSLDARPLSRRVIPPSSRKAGLDALKVIGSFGSFDVASSPFHGKQEEYP